MLYIIINEYIKIYTSTNYLSTAIYIYILYVMCLKIKYNLIKQIL